MSSLIGIISIVIGVSLILSIYFFILIKIKKNSQQTITKLDYMKSQIRRPENLFHALDRISNTLKSLKQLANESELKSSQEEILKKLNLLEGVILKSEEIKQESDLRKDIKKFEADFNGLKTFFDSILNDTEIKINNSLKKEIENELASIEDTIRFIELDLRQYGILTEQFKNILEDQRKFLHNESENLDDLIRRKLDADFSQLKEYKRNDFEEMKTGIKNLIRDFEKLKEKFLENLKIQGIEFKESYSKIKAINDRMDISETGFENSEKELSQKIDMLNERNRELFKNNNDLASHLKGMKEIQVDLKNGLLGIDSIKNEFDKLKIEITEQPKKIRDNLKYISEIINDFERIKNVMANSEKSYSDLNVQISGMLTSINENITQLADSGKQFEDKLKEIGEIRQKLNQYIDKELGQKVEECLLKNTEGEIEKNLYKEYIGNRFYQSVPPEKLYTLIMRIKDEPEISEEYRSLTINFLKDLNELEDLYRDKWYWDLLRPFKSQLDRLLLPFIFSEGKTIYDVFQKGKSANFNLKDITPKDLKQIINEHHWVQIWEPLLRWTSFFSVYYDDEMKLLVDYHQYSAAKIENFLREKLGYRIELYRPMAVIPKAIMKEGEVEEIPSHIVFSGQILEKVRKKIEAAAEEIEVKPDQRLIIFVDRVGLFDKKQRIRESKLLCYNSLSTKQNPENK